MLINIIAHRLSLPGAQGAVEPVCPHPHGRGSSGGGRQGHRGDHLPARPLPQARRHGQALLAGVRGARRAPLVFLPVTVSSSALCPGISLQ